MVLGVITIVLAIRGKHLWDSWRQNWIDAVDAIWFLFWAVIQLIWVIWMLWGTEDDVGLEKNWKVGTFTGFLLLFFMFMAYRKPDEEA